MASFEINRDEITLHKEIITRRTPSHQTVRIPLSGSCSEQVGGSFERFARSYRYRLQTHLGQLVEASLPSDRSLALPTIPSGPFSLAVYSPSNPELSIVWSEDIRPGAHLILPYSSWSSENTIRGDLIGSFAPEDLVIEAYGTSSQSQTPAATARLNEEARFFIPGLPKATYRLILRNRHHPQLTLASYEGARPEHPVRWALGTHQGRVRGRCQEASLTKIHLAPVDIAATFQRLEPYSVSLEGDGRFSVRVPYGGYEIRGTDGSGQTLSLGEFHLDKPQLDIGFIAPQQPGAVTIKWGFELDNDIPLGLTLTGMGRRILLDYHAG